MGGVLDVHARNVTELDGLARQGKCPGNHGLGGDHGGHGRQPHQGNQGPTRRQQVERVTRRLRVAEQERTLAEIVQH
ncbi:hypothetical protein D3C81_1765740 [compost metagenome]